MKKLLNAVSITVAFLLLLCGCGAQNSAKDLLTGTIQVENLKTFQVVYSLEGDIFSAVYYDVTPSEDGKYSFNLDLPEKTLDVSLYVNDDIFGAHLEKGKTAVVDIKSKGRRELEVSFSGDNADLSRVYNSYVKAYDMMKYFSMSGKSKTYDEYYQLAFTEHNNLKYEIDAIKSKKYRKYYNELSEGSFAWTKIRIIMDRAYGEHKKYKDYPEYCELVNTINPNNPINLQTNLLVAWFGNLRDELGIEDEGLAFIEAMKRADKTVTDPVCKAFFIRYFGYYGVLLGGAGDRLKEFWEAYKEIAKDYPEVIKQYQPQVDSKEVIAAGNDIPYDPKMTTIDGQTARLSDFIGKFVYVDIWATWCGPCCAEIPHLEKVAEHFKNNDKVKIISISTDSDKKAWEEKVKADKPIWAQYILSREENSKFSKEWGIQSIPRFLMIDKEGKIFNGDAKRPSDPELIKLIESQL